jgi:hypothetical protein
LLLCDIPVCVRCLRRHGLFFLRQRFEQLLWSPTMTTRNEGVLVKRRLQTTTAQSLYVAFTLQLNSSSSSRKRIGRSTISRKRRANATDKSSLARTSLRELCSRLFDSDHNCNRMIIHIHRRRLSQLILHPPAIVQRHYSYLLAVEGEKLHRCPRVSSDQPCRVSKNIPRSS